MTERYGTFLTEEDECTDGKVHSDCGCKKTCADMNAVCGMCYEGCYCPPEKPFILDDGTCGDAYECNDQDQTKPGKIHAKPIMNIDVKTSLYFQMVHAQHQCQLVKQNHNATWK